MGMNVNAVGITPSKAVSYNQAPAFTGKKAKAENDVADIKKPSKAKKAAKTAAKVAVVLAAVTTILAAFAGGRANKANEVTFDGNFFTKNVKKLGSNIAEGGKAAYAAAKTGAGKALEFIKGLGKGKSINDAS